MVRVAFICTHNSCRSIMAEGWARHLGSNILKLIQQELKVIQIQNHSNWGVEDCGSMSHAKSKLISDIPKDFDIIITMVAVLSVHIPSKHQEDWV